MSHTESEAPENAAGHWSATRTLMWSVLAVWAIFSFVIHFFVSGLNTIPFIGFPFGFYMAAQGSLVIFVVTIFFYAWRQNAIDEEFGVAED